MSSNRRTKKNRNQHDQERRISVRGIRRDPPDIRKLSRALINLALAEAEREAAAQRAAETQPGSGVTANHDGDGEARSA